MHNYFQSVLGDIPVISSAVMIRKGTFEQVGFFAEGSQLGEDQDMWVPDRHGIPGWPMISDRALYIIRVHRTASATNITVLQKYPVMQTVEDVLTDSRTKDGFMEKYLCKLRMDYAVRLIRAEQLSQAS